MAATFNDSLLRQVSDVISTEARAKYNLSTAAGRRQQYMDLTFWSPNINIFRDPRWGRGQETYGEDPFLTASMGTAFVKACRGRGYGLSYTSFAYSWKDRPAATRTLKDTLSLSITVRNTGPMDGDEVAQAYIRYPDEERMPLKELKGFKRLSIQKGAERSFEFRIPMPELEKWDLTRRGWMLYPGRYQVVIGGHSEDAALTAGFTVK